MNLLNFPFFRETDKLNRVHLVLCFNTIFFLCFSTKFLKVERLLFFEAGDYINAHQNWAHILKCYLIYLIYFNYHIDEGSH